jgi:hypothetical protein
MGRTETPNKLAIWLGHPTGGFAGWADDPIPTAAEFESDG